tara:strand:+ start:6915 stop:7364 length:450 start_codon:yes stop_codon:yes gene_type:complete
MASQAELDQAYIDMAYRWSKLSKANRKQVGCIVVKDGVIISDGYNGTPSGFDNDCEFAPRNHLDMELITKPEVLHAESNAITKLAKSTQSSEGATMYITIAPCIECSKLIIQSAIARVVIGDLYKNNEGINLLKKAGIPCWNQNTKQQL